MNFICVQRGIRIININILILSPYKVPLSLNNSVQQINTSNKYFMKYKTDFSIECKYNVEEKQLVITKTKKKQKKN